MIALAAWCCTPLALCQTTTADAPPPTHPQLQRELLDLRREDQEALTTHQLPADRLLALQQAHTRRLKAIVNETGWPTLSMVGNEAAQGAWLLVQHADDDHAWQRKALGLMEAQAPRNEVRKADIAYLRDRLDVADGLPQRYGTQGGCAAQGKWAPARIEEPGQVDARRRAMDLTSLDAYVAKASDFLCKNHAAQ